MTKCSAPIEGHISADARAECPACPPRTATASPPAASAIPTLPCGRSFEIATTAGTQRIVGGTPSNDARDAFMNGQCLALAVALSIDLGTDRVLAAYQTETEYQWGDGDEPVDSVVWPIPLHMWAVDADGVAWDYDGDRDVEAVVEEMEDLHSDVLIVEMDAEMAVARFEDCMPEQDYEFAETFVPVVRSAA